MLSVKEVAKILGVGEYTIKEWVKEGKLESIDNNNEMVFSDNAVDNFISETKIKLITPENQMKQMESMINSDGGFDINEYCKNNSVLSVEEIEKLINEAGA